MNRCNSKMSCMEKCGCIGKTTKTKRKTKQKTKQKPPVLPHTMKSLNASPLISLTPENLLNFLRPQVSGIMQNTRPRTILEEENVNKIVETRKETDEMKMKIDEQLARSLDTLEQIRQRDRARIKNLELDEPLSRRPEPKDFPSRMKVRGVDYPEIFPSYEEYMRIKARDEELLARTGGFRPKRKDTEESTEDDSPLSIFLRPKDKPFSGATTTERI